MAAGEIHVGDVGLALQSQILDQSGNPVNLTSASIQVILQPPKGAAKILVGSFVNNGTDGWVQYITQAGDLSMPGEWRFEIFVNFPNGPLHSDIITFKVYPNLV